MRLKILVVFVLLLNACYSMAQLPERNWPDFSCRSEAIRLSFVELALCIEAGAYTDVQVLAGSTPSMVFEQQDAERFDALFYEADALSVQVLAKQLAQTETWQVLDTLFRLPAKAQKSELETLLLRAFEINDATRLLMVEKNNYRAYIRINPQAADNTIYLTQASSNELYRLVGNFSKQQAMRWLQQMEFTIHE